MQCLLAVRDAVILNIFTLSRRNAWPTNDIQYVIKEVREKCGGIFIIIRTYFDYQMYIVVQGHRILL